MLENDRSLADAYPAEDGSTQFFAD